MNWWSINWFPKFVGKLFLIIFSFMFFITFGVMIIIINSFIKFVLVWQLSNKYRKKHKEYWLEGEFNPIEFVIHSEGDKGIAEMLRR